MRAWMELGVLLLCGTAAGAGLAMAEPLLELQPTPQDPAALAACFDDAQLGLLEKLNRIDRDRLPKLPSLVQPRDWNLDELELAPLPARLDWAAELAKIVIVHQPLQAFGAYEAGALVHWGPVSTGAERSPTPAGLYFLNWRSAGRHSTVNRSWFLRWYFNFDNSSGRSFHQYELPGGPGSHGCVRLLARDAQYIFHWGEGWELDESRRRVQAPGTPVFIVGDYDFENPCPWRDPALVADGFAAARSGRWLSYKALNLALDRPALLKE